jgi:hypothetical protein
MDQICRAARGRRSEEKPRSAKEPSPEERAADEKALDDLTDDKQEG